MNTGLLQRTAANVQNTANTSTASQAQLSSSISRQLDNMTKILHTNFNCIDADLKKLVYNRNLIYNTIETRHLASEQLFTSIEEDLARLGMQPQAPIVQSPLLYYIQQQAVPLQEQGGAAAGPPPPPVPPLSRYI